MTAKVRALKAQGDGSAAAYYLDLASRDLTDYYAGRGESPGVWLGSGATALAEKMGVDPATGTQLDDAGAAAFAWLLSAKAGDSLLPDHRRQSGSGERVLGFDLTFGAPKGLSVLAAATDREDLRAAIHAAHDAAVAATMQTLEREICFVRRGKGGVRVEPGEGLIAASFRHRLARPVDAKEVAPDPHLHTHVVVANLVRGSDNQWSALDGRSIYDYQFAADGLYRAALIANLRERGVNLPWVKTANNLVEVDADPRLLKAFSRRHDELIEAARERGWDSAGGHVLAQRATRNAKDKEVAAASNATVAERTQQRLAQIELGTKAQPRPATLDDLHGLLLEQPTVQPTTDDGLRVAGEQATAPLGHTLDEPDHPHLAHRRATFNRPDTIRALALSVELGGAEPAQVLAAADELLVSSHVVRLEHVVPSHASDRTEDQMRRDAASAGAPWRKRYSTPEIVQMERRIASMAARGAASGCGVVTPEHLDQALAGSPWLAGEQVAAVRHLTRSGHQVALVVGVAGAGKTTMLRVAREAWESEGRTVLGATLAARAAGELHSGAGIQSSTIASLVGGLDRGNRLLPGTVVVVDEAVMADSRSLAALASAVAAAPGAQLVLVGDPRQIQSVEAGGIASLIVAEHPELVSVLEQNRRQSDATERARLANLRQGGDVKQVVQAWSEAERIHVVPTRDDAVVAMVEAWHEAREAGQDTVMLARTRADVLALNEVARSLRVAKGEVEAGDQVATTGQHFAPGDEVVGLRNDRSAGIHNGERGVVLATKSDELGQLEQVVVELDESIAVLDRSYLEAGDLGHGYALTVHKSQGMTTDVALVLATDDVTRELAYVMASRARERTDFYLPGGTPEPDDDAIAHTAAVEDARTPEERWAEAASKRAEQFAALAHGVEGDNDELEPDEPPEPITPAPTPAPDPEPDWDAYLGQDAHPERDDGPQREAG